ncbi:hypothetical protein [Ferruginibacter sp.]
MKNKLLVFLFFSTSFFGCGQSNATSQDKTNNDQSFEISIDNKKYNLSTDDIFSANYIGQTHLTLVALSEKKDISFSVTAFITTLQPGTYQVYECNSASTCSQEEDDKNQNAMFSPYPKDPMVPVNLSRTAYNAPELGLKPLVLTITSVTDEQQAGVPFKTKRIKGQFNGTLAYVEKQDDGNWKIVGNTTHIDGKFDLFCSIR